ncbi:MAG: hypothetical protein SFX73_07725 [Kofleriaceae bacterium]|nr:hypothetical protein [Kofleriaceae bacterium]
MEPRISLQRVDEAEHLLHELWGCDERYISKTIAHEDASRTVLFALRRGSRILLERTLGDLALRVVVGHIELHEGDVWDQLPYFVRHTEGACSFFSLYDHSIDLPIGALLLLDPESPHDLEALDDSAFVLDIRA